MDARITALEEGNRGECRELGRTVALELAYRWRLVVYARTWSAQDCWLLVVFPWEPVIRKTGHAVRREENQKRRGAYTRCETKLGPEGVSCLAGATSENRMHTTRKKQKCGKAEKSRTTPATEKYPRQARGCRFVSGFSPTEHLPNSAPLRCSGPAIPIDCPLFAGRAKRWKARWRRRR